MFDRSVPVQLMINLGFPPDPWQIEVLDMNYPRLLLNCCRQAGKSTVVAMLALVAAFKTNVAKILILSRSHRQSKELLRQIVFMHQLLSERGLKRRTVEELQLTNESRIISVPCREETIRGFSGVDLLVIDEAARVPDDLYRAVRPMLAVSGGRLVCLSTPHGKRGFFWDAWSRGGDDWARIEIPASKIHRIKPEFLEQERRALGEAWFRQEYCCSFEALEGLVYPDFAQCILPETDPEWLAIKSELDRGARYRHLGGIDFGFRNPFAALWGILVPDSDPLARRASEGYPIAPHPRGNLNEALPPRGGGLGGGDPSPQGDHRPTSGVATPQPNCAASDSQADRLAVGSPRPTNGILYLTGEHYARKKPLSYHAQHLPRHVQWYADPAGASDISELRVADFHILKGRNPLRTGIAAVTARIESGALRILKGRCPNLVHEASLYRYEGDPNSEDPLDQHNHALAALRYLIARLDEHHHVAPARTDPAPHRYHPIPYYDDD